MATDSNQHSTPQGARQIRDALTAMRDQGDCPGFYEEASDALVALDNLVEQLEALGDSFVRWYLAEVFDDEAEAREEWEHIASYPASGSDA